MAKKIDIRGETVWVLNDLGEPSGSEPRRSQASRSDRLLERNPALAFSLSVLIWGGGQFYNRQWQLGVLYFLFMVNFYLFPAVILGYWEPITTGLRTLDVTASEILVTLGIFFVGGLLVWIINAVHAYYGAADEPAAFEGVKNPLLPAICSLLLPGWGQVLNGQARKGACFLLVAMAGLFAIAALLVISFLWPTLDTAIDRRFAEGMLFVAVLLVPPVLLVWGGSVYDAVKVCVDPMKKQPIRIRMESAVNRMRMAGWRGFFRRAELTVMFSLYLVFSLTLSRYYFPQDYYAALLKDLQAQTARQHMVVIPRRIDRLLQSVFPGQSHH
jgi:TM2 domain-containing membrane protein YozV